LWLWWLKDFLLEACGWVMRFSRRKSESFEMKIKVMEEENFWEPREKS